MVGWAGQYVVIREGAGPENYSGCKLESLVTTDTWECGKVEY